MAAGAVAGVSSLDFLIAFTWIFLLEKCERMMRNLGTQLPLAVS